MQISNIELDTTKTGKPFKKITLEDGRKFNVFNFHSQYEQIIAGYDVPETSIIKDGKFLNLADAEKSTKTNFKNAGIKEGMAIKKENIREAQDYRNEGIKLAGSCRDATLIITAYKEKYEGFSDQELKTEWLAWREWFYKQWTDNLPPPF